VLNEVELIADEMILIGHGKIVAQGDKKTLLSMDTKVSSLVMSLDNARLAEALTQKGFSAVPEGEGLRVSCSPEDVGRTALEAQVVLTDLRSGAAGLEDLFLELTSDSQRDVLTEGAPA
jgi:ABC-2 type transport system ATP-binding protein